MFHSFERSRVKNLCIYNYPTSYLYPSHSLAADPDIRIPSASLPCLGQPRSGSCTSRVTFLHPLSSFSKGNTNPTPGFAAFHGDFFLVPFLNFKLRFFPKRFHTSSEYMENQCSFLPAFILSSASGSPCSRIPLSFCFQASPWVPTWTSWLETPQHLLPHPWGPSQSTNSTAHHSRGLFIPPPIREHFQNSDSAAQAQQRFF